MRNNVFAMTKAGDLVPYSDPEAGDEKKEDFDTYIKRIGFGPRVDYIGDPDSDSLEWFESTRDGAFQYLAAWNDHHGYRMIFVPDWPALLKLQALAAPIIQAKLLEYRIAEIQGLVTKLFRVYHEHDPYDVCDECDPSEARLRRARREERASRS